ncbi:LPXTG cell wall anchor domain-containing protein [Lacticaseibacillus parakribbianus]|uniref:LPXTG cell wall anchor domain-containing protein n=1 Tax=Lacticaseibacillus parakribbianus TaxID=2970927 RepID=UPI0021CAF359|nr:LPXTG cell wall anchor domain-containing protein [Lacticaseibacillus parakribbianus]
MYGNSSKAGLAGAAVLPATGGVISPWVAVIGYAVLAVTLVSFFFLWRATKRVH